jgi:hypothetical protein
VNVNKNNIRSNLSDIFEGDDDIGFAIQKIQYSAAPRDHDLPDAAAALIKLQITDSPQFFAVLYVDHILAFQLRKQQRPHLIFFSILYEAAVISRTEPEYFFFPGTY